MAAGRKNPPSQPAEESIVIEARTTNTRPRQYKMVGLYLAPEQIDRLDALASETNRTRSELVRMLLDRALAQVTIRKP